ncbi:MAG: hypothetical protein QOF56_223, partial [Acidobacteriaceae bacterium]|nr:hypothetical protein [Acidobacteriaceae bacterium]
LQRIKLLTGKPHYSYLGRSHYDSHRHHYG